MKAFSYLQNYGLWTLLIVAALVTGCRDDEEPDVVNEPEVITDVTLVFTAADGTVVRAAAQDPDGEGVEELEILDEITLKTGTVYTLTYEIFNNLDTPGENIGDEILEEDDEHQIFFSFTEGAFSDPSGNGNIDNAADPINYNDTDDNNRPVGLNTTWTTGETAVTGTFTAKLQHQPDVKTDDSGANDGDTDFDLTFVLNIE